MLSYFSTFNKKIFVRQNFSVAKFPQKLIGGPKFINFLPEQLSAKTCCRDGVSHPFP
jgi:hypothetical protein